MENSYSYFSRDVSWLSFNYRVLLESRDESLPIFERIKFLSIHASNLEEFYKIRVAEHRGVIMQKVHSEEDPAESERVLEDIRAEVTHQQQEFSRIFNNEILPELEKNNIVLYMNNQPQPFHLDFVRDFFREEIFPFLQPAILLKDEIKIFIRDNRLYQVVQLRKKENGKQYYAIIKIPFTKVPRFIKLPSFENKYYFMFVEDMISANLSEVFPGFTVEGCYNIKISRDADIYIDEEIGAGNELVETIIKKVKKRKIGDLSRFVYDREMPRDCLQYICETFHIGPDDRIPDNAHLNMEDLIKLPNPCKKESKSTPYEPVLIPSLSKAGSILPAIRKRNIFLHYPYHPFNYFTRFLSEAASNPKVDEIKVTQYRVAQDSEVISNLINAASNGKKVTVFVELKARFDEENNLYTAEAMKQAGIRIIYSLPGLKVHAKVALVIEKPGRLNNRTRYAYLSTGNFNEKTAQLYSDMSIFTSNKNLTKEIDQVFDVLEGKIKEPKFKQLLVAQFNLVPELTQMIRREIQHVKQGKKGYIILKMNGLQDKSMIDEIYRASEAGVKIDLIIRGICCLIPNQPYSKNIRITRIVDMFLEHSRIWYFYNDGKEDLYLTSADWMRRNLYRRIETASPVLDKNIKQTIIDILKIQLNDNRKACFIDENLNNVFKERKGDKEVWAQRDIYNLLAGKK